MNAIEKPSSSGAAADASPTGNMDPAALAPAELAALALQFRQALGGTAGLQADASPKAGIGLPGARQVVDGSAPNPDLSTLLGDTLFAKGDARATGPGLFPSSFSPAAGTRAKTDWSSGTATAANPTVASLSGNVGTGSWRGDNEKGTEANADPTPDTIGSAVLQSLMLQSSGAAPVANAAAPAAAATSTSVQSLESVVAETVSRVLVSDPLHDGRREVRIEVAKEVLPDTQIRLWRQDGRLHVEFTSPQSVAENGLQDALPRLGNAIQQRQPELEAPVVSLRTTGMDAGGQPGDGRSRQQYYLPGEEELA